MYLEKIEFNYLQESYPINLYIFEILFENSILPTN